MITFFKSPLAKVLFVSCIAGLNCVPSVAAPVQVLSQTPRSSSTGELGSSPPQFSADEKPLLFLSHPKNLIQNEGSGKYLNLYEKTLVSKKISLVSTSSSGFFANGASGTAS